MVSKSLLDRLSVADDDASVVKRSLNAIRAHLGMEVAYVSEFVGERTVFREVDAPGLEAVIKVGDSQSLDDVYCRHILAGRLPALMRDTSTEPLAASMPITGAVPIGKHMSVPIRLDDGEIYGMFCCLGFAPDPSLQERDLGMMRAFADLAAFEINRERTEQKAAAAKEQRIQSVIDEAQFTAVFQPIVDLKTRRTIGLECLTRFSAAPQRTPDKWFNEAAETGLGVTLELAAIEKALSALSSLPPGIYVAVNASPDTILHPGLAEILARYPAERLVLEVTEHANVADYDQLNLALQPLRVSGVRLAVDDAGAGYSSLRHILHLRPDLIKLDNSLTLNIALDPARRALASAMVSFAKELDCSMVAEGVETAHDLAVLEAIGIEKGQGYFLARPMPLDAVIAHFEREAAEPPHVQVA